MAETIVKRGSVAKWHWYNVMADLQEQGGLKGVIIDPLTVDKHGCGGSIGDNPFYITWLHEKLLLVTMETFSKQLVDAFARVVEYKPFCRYERDGMVTVEWDKVSPQSRFEELQHETEVQNLREM